MFDNVTGLLDFLQHAQELGVISFADLVMQCFAQLEPWNRAEAYDHKLVIDMVVDVHQNEQHFDLITASLEAIKDGQIFAEAVLQMCDLLNSDRASPAEVVELLKRMLQIASKAHKRAVSIGKELRGFLQSLKNLDNGQAEDRRTPRSLTLPQTFITPPLVGPAMIEVEKNRRQFSLQPRLTTKNTLQDVPSTLNNTSTDISRLLTSVTSCINWWASLEDRLAALKQATTQLDVRGINPLQVKNVKDLWTSLRKNCVTYDRKVNAIRNSYSPTNPQMRNENAINTSDAWAAERISQIPDNEPPHDLFSISSKSSTEPTSNRTVPRLRRLPSSASSTKYDTTGAEISPGADSPGPLYAMAQLSFQLPRDPVSLMRSPPPSPTAIRERTCCIIA